jgi:hypothetical protein
MEVWIIVVIVSVLIIGAGISLYFIMEKPVEVVVQKSCPTNCG